MLLLLALSTYNIHVMIEFLLIILTDGLKAVIRHDKLFVLLARVIQFTKEIFVFFRNLEEFIPERILEEGTKPIR